MTPAPTQPRDDTDPQLWDGMTVEVALSVMASARTEGLVVRDDHGRRTGLVTRARLTAFRAGTAYTDRVKLSEFLGLHGRPCASAEA